MTLFIALAGGACSGAYCAPFSSGSSAILIGGLACHAYTCPGGVAVDGAPAIDGEVRCVNCNVGHSLEGAACVPNVYTCQNGIASEGMPDVSGALKCIACDEGYRLAGAMCVPSAYICPNGTAAEGEPVAADALKCVACDVGYRLDGTAENQKCVANVYSCVGGVPLAGRPEGDETIGCQRCDDGYLPVGTLGVVGAMCDADSDKDTIRNGLDVDDDGDGLIELANAAELGAMRHNLAGNGLKLTAGGDNGEGGSGNTSGSGSTAGCGDGAVLTVCNGYELAGNIDLAGVAWRPIGTPADPFTAILEGNNFAISNLTLAGDSAALGFFGQLGGGTQTAVVRNVALIDARVTRTGWDSSTRCASGVDTCGGVLAGRAYADLVNVRVSGAYGGDNGASYEQTMGGVIGLMSAGGITHAHASVAVSGGGGDIDYLGGLVGRQEGGRIAISSAAGAISDTGGGGDALGGLVGVQEGLIEIVWASGAVSGDGGGDDALGGLIGIQESGAVLQNGIAVGPVSADALGADIAGGLIGQTHGVTETKTGVSFSTAIQSYALGAVSTRASSGGAGGSADKLGGYVGAIKNFSATVDFFDKRLSGYWNTQTAGQCATVCPERIGLSGFWNTQTTGQATATATNAMFGDVLPATTAEFTTPAGSASVRFPGRAWGYASGEYPALRFDHDGDGLFCFIRPILSSGNANDTTARFVFRASGDLDDPPCTLFNRQ